MDRLYWFITLLLLSLSAHADFPSTFGTWSIAGSSFNATPSAACRSFANNFTGTTTAAAVATTTGDTGNCAVTPSGGTTNNFVMNGGNPQCSAGSTQISYGVCQCTAPAVQNSAGTGCFTPLTAVQADCASRVGTTEQNSVLGARTGNGCVYYLPGSGFPSDQGCAQIPLGVHVTRVSPAGVTTTSGTHEFTGQACTAGGTAEITRTSCVGYFGEVNGINTCVPFSANTPASTTSLTSKTVTVTATTLNSSGTSVTSVRTTTDIGSSTTSCTGSQCITTTRVNNRLPDGTTSTSVQTANETKDDFCKVNPRSPLCVSSTFAGVCDGSFKGTGDALAVATAEAVNRTRCLLDPGVALNPVSAQLAAGTFGTDLETKTKNIGSFTQTNPFGNSVQDQQMTIAGTSFVIPLSSMQGFLVAMGNLAVIFTLLYSTVFVIRAI